MKYFYRKCCSICIENIVKQIWNIFYFYTTINFQNISAYPFYSPSISSKLGNCLV